MPVLVEAARARRRTGMLSGRAARAGTMLLRSFMGERDRWVLWLPVALGCGVAGYFGLPVEPPLWSGAAAFALAVGAAVAVRRNAAALLLAVAVATVALGFTAASLRTASVAEPVLARKLGPVMVSGRIVHVDVLPNARRVVLEEISFGGRAPSPAPSRIRIRLRGQNEELRAGRRLQVRAVLLPPPGPAAPGAFDFQRYLFYRGIGAVGYAIAAPLVLSDGGAGGQPGFAISALRQSIAARVMTALPGATGAVAAALMTGERKAIPEKVLAAFRDSGIAHLLAISGLHIGLVAGLLFFGVRAGLALCGPLAVRWPVKKIAAVAALIGAFGYLLISGSTVPTQRAYIMLLIVLLGVLLDRIGLSMRLVAWAAAAVLLLAPESLFGASFQMSFAAVVGLVAIYEVLGPPLAARRRAAPAWAQPAMYLAAVALTSLVAGLATSPFAAFHFNRLAVFGLATNMLAVPLTALWIMPWAVFAFVLMPLGLESLALTPMGWGIDAVIAVAVEVSSWPGAVALAPAMPGAGLALAALGGLWLALWQRRWRLWGVPAIALGLASVMLPRPPDILVSGDGRLLAVRGADGALMLSSARAGRFTADVWLRRDGQTEKPVWPRAGVSADGRIACDSLGCVYRAGGEVVALARASRALGEDCRLASVVVSLEPVRGGCASAAVVIDRFDLWKKGSHALWIGPKGVRVENARDVRGERPWVLKPETAARPRRREPPAAATAVSARKSLPAEP